jgi:galactonate dehydratase
MKITNVLTHVVMVYPPLEWVFVELETDEGITGVGECSDYGSAEMLVAGIEALKPAVIGMDPRNIEDTWQRIFHRYSDLSGPGFVSHLISAIDIALWDIKGKVLGVPIYQLLGGRVRDQVTLYTHVPDRSGNPNPAVAAEAARAVKEAGFRALKSDPFASQFPAGGPRGGDMVERLSPGEIARSAEYMHAIRDAVGPDYEILVDAHARFDVASAIRAARALEPIKPVWFEEPIPVEGINAFRQVRENATIPLCVGERHFTRWDYAELFKERLVDYVMPDVAWTGGISELRRIASQAEAYFIRISPHDALGPVMLMAAFQVDLATPNLYRQECVHEFFEHYAKIITPMFDWHDGAIWPSDRPGLGIELNREGLERFRVAPTDPRILRGLKPSGPIPTVAWDRAAVGGAGRGVSP